MIILIINRVAGYYGYSEYVNEISNKSLFEVNYDEFRSSSISYFEKDKNIVQLRKIASWLSDRNSTIEEQPDKSFLLIGVRFLSEKSGSEIEKYDKNPYEKIYTFKYENEEIMDISNFLNISFFC